MKTCPYCAEEIKDEAIRCRWCHVWLVDEAPRGADDARPPEGLERRDTADAGMGGAMTGPSTEPLPVAAEAPSASAGAASASGMLAAGEPAGPTTPMTSEGPTEESDGSAAAPATETKVEFTHTGTRYLLGYGEDFFGIWDRNAPQQPVERFARDDQGWAAAWQRYVAIENNWMDLRTGQKSG